MIAAAQTLEIKQTEISKTYIELWLGFFDQKPELVDLRLDDVARLKGLLESYQNKKNLKLKEIEAPVSRLLSSLLSDQRLRDHKEKLIEVVKSWETLFLKLRSNESFEKHFALVFDSFIERLAKCKHIWVPGSGRSMEIPWFASKFKNCQFTCMDIKEEYVEDTKKLIAERSLHNVKASQVDLLKENEIPKDEVDGILFFHPFVIS